VDPSRATAFRLAAALALAAAVVAVFWPLFSAEFVNYDDPQYVARNPHLREGFTAASLRWAFTAGYAANWHPLTWMSHLLDWTLFGPRAGGHHAVSVILHAANAVLLFLLLERLTAARWRSAVAAALFAVHPLRVESVAWISERKDVLSTLLGLSALLAYAGYARRPSPGRMVGVAALLAAGLAAKPMLVTLPFVMLLLDAWPLRRLRLERASWPAVGPLLAEKTPLFALAAVSAAVTYLVQRSAEAMTLSERIGFPLRAGNAVLSYGAYLRDTAWPAGLAVFYPHPGKSLALAAVAGSAVLLAALTAAAVRLRRSHPYLLVGWLWYLVTLVPVIGLVQVGSQGRADRYTYLPLVGIFVALAWGCGDALDALARRRGAKVSAPVSSARLWPLLAALPFLAAAAHVQAATWSDSVALWTHALSATGPNAEAQVNLANALAERGRTDAALSGYREALRTSPSHPDALNGLGLILLGRGQTGDALPLLEKAVAMRPSFAGAHSNLAVALAKAGRRDEALRHAVTAARLEPDLPEARANAGALLLRAGRADEAIFELEAACRLDPASAGAHADLAAGYYLAGRYAEAWKEVALARRLGAEPSQELLRALSGKLPDPGGRR
jgi:Flp pilus assembly protein TadD